MSKGRLEAFTDGVMAVLITIMVLELHEPEGASWTSLLPLVPVFLAYVLSFVMLGIYWNNHHHLLQATEHVTGGVLWANLHLLFWLSLVPATTAWMGRNHSDPVPTATYGFVLVMCAIAYTLLQLRLIKHHGRASRLATAVGSDRKGHLSLLLYASAIPLAFVNPTIADAIFVAVALIWLVPDRRIETTIRREHPTHQGVIR
jgi:uncharacterized membrane protein